MAPHQVILFSQPRSGSHLLERMLASDQPGVAVLAHPFSGSRGLQVPWLLRGDYAEGMGEGELGEYERKIEEEVKVWEAKLEEAEGENKSLFLHSHPFFPVSPSKTLDLMRLATTLGKALASEASGANLLTSLPSENFFQVPSPLLLRPGSIPLISIRRPRLSVPSTHRVLQRMNLPHGGSRAFFLQTTCNVWNCVLYNFYVSRGVEPVVVDAGDYMGGGDGGRQREFVRALCGRLGLDGGRARFEWEAVAEGEVHPMFWASQGTLLGSQGVGDGRVKVEEEWEAEFGGDVGLVRETVGLAEPFWRVLWERRWRG